MAERRSAGEGLSERLSARGSPGLARRAMPDGGEVYSGPLARRALRSVGARAMTVEGGDIVVDSEFDPSRPQDAALYAHERLHQRTSGGSGGGAAGHNDAEERAARAIESMVLHRMEAGENLAEVLQDVTLGRAGDLARNALQGGTSVLSQMVARAVDLGERNLAMEAYWLERSQGKPHAEVIDDLKQWVVQRLEQIEQDQRFRTTER